MQIIKSFIRVIIFICPVIVTAQTTYFSQGSKEYQFIDRLEIKQQSNTNLNFSAIKPYSRKAIIQAVEYINNARIVFSYSHTGIGKSVISPNLTRIDEYNLNSLLMNNSEWVTRSKEDFLSKTPIFKTFYKTKPNLIEVNTKDLFLVVNPLLNVQVGSQQGGGDKVTYLNTRGITARGMIANRIGFSTSITDNQERGPQYFQDNIIKFRAVPGAGFYKSFKTAGVDYFDARGYITFNAAKYIDFQFGYDKNFIGNGYRSLFLSDVGNSYLFLKINTRIWKLNYQNLFMELMPQYSKNHGDTLLDRKYAAMHHLDMNVTKWLNVGLFEGIIFGRKNHFDFQYLNPIIFLRHIEGTVGSPDNALAGIDFKANVAHKLQFYGQFMLDEFQLSQIKKNTGYWANKFGIQTGLKYTDAFTISNLDIQLESNRVRPFTYSHNDTIANYTHYNQSLAHPLGASFQEYIAIIKYQPAPKWYITAKAIAYTQGLDSAGLDFGGNPLEDYTNRPRDYGFNVGSGNKATCLNTSFQLSYELKENLFIEGSIQYRDYQIKNTLEQNKTTLISFGIRWNMFKREYDL